jgi:hypothetical protein
MYNQHLAVYNSYHAQDIYNACEHASFGGEDGVNGQESDSAGYVIVAGSSC